MSGIIQLMIVLFSKIHQTTSPKPKKMTEDYTNELNISR